MRICTRISTGKIIEMQSSATAGTLIANAVAHGIAADDLLEEVVTPADYKARMDIQEPPPAPPTADELEIEVQQLLNGDDGVHIEWRKLLKAKFVSDLAWRLGVAPTALTGPQLVAERNRIAAIYKAL